MRLLCGLASMAWDVSTWCRWRLDSCHRHSKLLAQTLSTGTYAGASQEPLLPEGAFDSDVA